MTAQSQLPLSETLASEMSLFQLDETLSLLMESATEETTTGNGEIPDELRQALLDYGEAFGAKVDNIANYIKAQEGEARNAKVEIERLQSRQAVAENRVERLNGLLKYFMNSRGLRSMKGRLNTISLRRNSQDSLILETPEGVPEEFCKLSVTIAVPDDGNAIGKREPDNAKLRAALQSGRSILGAQLRCGQHVRLSWGPAGEPVTINRMPRRRRRPRLRPRDTFPPSMAAMVDVCLVAGIPPPQGRSRTWGMGITGFSTTPDFARLGTH